MVFIYYNTQNVKEIKVGDTVKWWKSTYTVIDILNGEALLQQNFSIGTILNEGVPLTDLTLIK